MTDIRSKNCILVSHCILAQMVMAEGLVKTFPAMVKPVIQWALDNDVNIVQMPCPETQCGAGGLGRGPAGKKFYEENGLRDISNSIAVEIVSYIEKLKENGNNILAIVGVDFSPACAVNYLNKGRTIVHDQGIYVEELKKNLEEKDISIDFIGISQRWHKKMIKDLDNLLVRSPENPLFVFD